MSTPSRKPASGRARGAEDSPKRTRSGGGRSRRQPGKIIDLFAGAGGWAEGLRMLGLNALGIELDKWACATSTAAGHEVLQADLAALDPQEFSPVWGLVGSPPCRAMLKALYPGFFAGIEQLEREAQAAGVRWCRWGGYDLHGNRAGEASRERPGLLCESCEARQHAPAPRARRRSTPAAPGCRGPRR